MLAPLFHIVLAVAVAGILVWGIDHWPAMDDTFKQMAKVIIIVVFAIYALAVIAQMFGLTLLH